MFKKMLKEVDHEISALIDEEFKRQSSVITLIASENLVSEAVLEAQGSMLTNKYAEGYPGKRYYGGCENVDAIERLAIERAKMLFDARFANVQPHSGSQANQAVFFALLNPHDKVLSLSLDCGGHLTHGHNVNMSGKWFEVMQYGLHRENESLDYEKIQSLAVAHKPKIIIAGYSAYPRSIDFRRFREIADSVGAYLMIDMAHFSGLVAAKVFDNPVKYAHVVTTTTHKTLRGPRGGMILTDDPEIAKKVDSAVFPGIQGGPLMHVIAAKAVAFKEALGTEYVEYIKKVVKNAKVVADRIIKRGYKLVTGGTDSHLLLVNLRGTSLTGNDVQKELEKVGIICNKNSIPFDELPPTLTSGVRIGTPVGTSRGFGEKEFTIITDLICDILDAMRAGGVNDVLRSVVVAEISKLCRSFPM